jgi:nucleoside-diphosphate-sugar epimerase
LAGLYLAKRGPHSYWLTLETIDGAADGIINMIHYEDAAGVVVKSALYNAGKTSPIGMETGQGDASFRSIFLACDDRPVTRSEICMAALESGLFPTAKMPSFTEAEGPKSKTVDSSLTRKLLGFIPKYKSFGYYMRSVIGGKPDTEVGIEVKKEVKKSDLWLPGMDDDDVVDLKL